MKSISIVIPVFNEEKFIGGLLKSIKKVNYPKEYYEIVVVNDASTDHTVEIVKAFPEAKVIDLPLNVGRYHARKKGAEAARYPNVLFIDSRAIVDPNILTALNHVDARAVNGYSLGIEKPGLFETFYNSIRRIIFHEFYKIYNHPFQLTLENFDSMPKGTGVFYCEKQILFDVYRELSNTDMGKDASDDTKMLRAIVNRVPILSHPGVKITNFACPSFTGSVNHLYNRGIKFVDYYFNPSRKNFWLVILIPLFVLIGLLIGLIFLPVSGLIKISVLLGLDILITIILSRSFREFYIILFMMPICVITFYTGIIRGIYLKCFHLLRH